MSADIENVRVRACFRPEWHGSIEGWVRNFIKSNAWRIASYAEPEDLYQEAYCIFEVCCMRYPEVKDPPHFMSLFMRSVSNRFHNMADKRTKERSRRVSSYDDEDGGGGGAALSELEILASIQRPSSELAEMNLRLAIEEAPPAIQTLVDSVQTMPSTLLGFLRDEFGARETGGERLARLAGLMVPVDREGRQDAIRNFRAQVEMWAAV